MSVKPQRGYCGSAPKIATAKNRPPSKTFYGESILIQLDDRPGKRPPNIYSFRAKCTYQPRGRRLLSSRGYLRVAGFGAAFPYGIHPNRLSGGPAARAAVPRHASIELVSFDPTNFSDAMRELRDRTVATGQHAITQRSVVAKRIGGTATDVGQAVAGGASALGQEMGSRAASLARRKLQRDSNQTDDFE
jgi:hypothetical protein